MFCYLIQFGVCTRKWERETHGKLLVFNFLFLHEVSKTFCNMVKQLQEIMSMYKMETIKIVDKSWMAYRQKIRTRFLLWQLLKGFSMVMDMTMLMYLVLAE